MPPNRGRGWARPEPSAKGVVVSFRGYRETVMLGGVGTCQGLRRLAPQPRPSLRLQWCHPPNTRIERVGTALSPARRKGVVVRFRGYRETVMLGGVGALAKGRVAWAPPATPFAEAQSVPPNRGQGVPPHVILSPRRRIVVNAL